MDTISKLRVHIAPLGFEVDRIVLPAQEMKADVLCLLVHSNRSEDLAKPFETEIKEKLAGIGIEIKSVYADRRNLFEILRVVKEVIKGDIGKNNDIYVNVSSGSKIQSIACMMACMMWNTMGNLTPYYAEPQEYASLMPSPAKRKKTTATASDASDGNSLSAQISYGIKDITALPKYHVQIPQQELVRALEIVRNSEGGRIKKREMAEKAEDMGIITINSREENKESARLMSLAKNIVDPLTNDWGFLRTEKIGRTRWVSLTEAGQNAAEFLL